MSWLVSTAPASEPLSVAEAKEQCRVTDGEDDSTIERLIVAAREFAEAFTHRTFIQTSLELRLESFPSSGPIYLPAPPYISMTSVEYQDTD